MILEKPHLTYPRFPRMKRIGSGKKKQERFQVNWSVYKRLGQTLCGQHWTCSQSMFKKDGRQGQRKKFTAKGRFQNKSELFWIEEMWDEVGVEVQIMSHSKGKSKIIHANKIPIKNSEN